MRSSTWLMQVFLYQFQLRNRYVNRVTMRHRNASHYESRWVAMSDNESPWGMMGHNESKWVIVCWATISDKKSTWIIYDALIMTHGDLWSIMPHLDSRNSLLIMVTHHNLSWLIFGTMHWLRNLNCVH